MITEYDRLFENMKDKDIGEAKLEKPQKDLIKLGQKLAKDLSKVNRDLSTFAKRASMIIGNPETNELLGDTSAELSQELKGLISSLNNIKKIVEIDADEQEENLEN